MDAFFRSAAQTVLSAPIDLHDGVASLSRGTYFKESSLEMTLKLLTNSAADISGVGRVGIWAFSDGLQELRCLELYDRDYGAHCDSIAILNAEQYPAYFRALVNAKGVAVDDPYVHPATAELGRDYLPQYQISARLDTPIYIRGDLQGLLTFEQVKTHFPWTTAHRLFAQAVANLVTLALVEFEVEEARREGGSAKERLAAVFEGSRDALLLADGETGVILDVNHQAESLFHCARSNLVGRHQKTLHPKCAGVLVGAQFKQALSGQTGEIFVSEILRADGQVQRVEISAQVADLSAGRRLILGTFRPI